MAYQLLPRNSQNLKRVLAVMLPCLLILVAVATASLNTAVSFGAAHLTATPASAETLSGTWTADAKRSKAADGIQLTFNRRSGGGHDSLSGNNYSLSDFQGLTNEQVFAASSTLVNFRLTREAGTLECEGSFRDGKGAGSWRLILNEAFRSALQGRGYNNLTDEQMFTAVALNVTSKFVDEANAMGYGRLPFESIVKARIFNVTPQFVAEMKSLGFENLQLEDLVKARIFQIDADFVRQVQAMGFERQSLEGLVKLRIFKITPEFIREMKAASFDNLSAEQLVKLRIFAVTPDFIKSMKAEGLSQISVEDAVKLKIHQVDENFIRRARASGYTDLSVRELVRLSIHGKVK